MTCEAIGRVLALCLGYMPQPGQMIDIPRRCERRMERVRTQAEQCALERGIRWRVVKN